jgi:hypothetical protein
LLHTQRQGPRNEVDFRKQRYADQNQGGGGGGKKRHRNRKKKRY